MRVVKVLNNSLVMALDQNGNETILMGKGIGFHKAAGYEFDEKEVEKVFMLHDRSISRSIIRLASEIDSVYFEISKKIIDHAIDTYKMELLDFIYLSLTDHIAFAVKRFAGGVVVPNFYLSELRRFNPEEYAIGVYAVELMKRKLEMDIPLDEAGHIAFQFINAQKDMPNRDKAKYIFELTDSIMNLVKYTYQIDYDEDSADFGRLITSVRRFARRYLGNAQYREDPSGRVYFLIEEHCPEQMDCAKRIKEFLNENYRVPVTNQELVVLALEIRQYLISVEGERYY